MKEANIYFWRSGICFKVSTHNTQSMPLLTFGGKSQPDSKAPKKMAKMSSKSFLGDRPIDHGIDVDKVIHRHAGSHKHTKNAFQYSSHVIQKPNALAMGDL